MNTEEVQLLFAARLNVFDPISGKPADADLTRLHEKLAVILLPLLYDVEKGVHNLMGLVLDEDEYKHQY